MKNYTKPEVDIIELAQDVIITSGPYSEMLEGFENDIFEE